MAIARNKEELLGHDAPLHDFVWKVLAAAGAIITSLAGVNVKSMMARIADKDKQLVDMRGSKDKQIADLVETNERLNVEKDELWQKFIDKLNGA